MNRSSITEDQEHKFTPSYKIIIVGNSASGKTSLLVRYQHGTFIDHITTTLAVDYHALKKHGVKFNYYDTAGQDRYRTYVNTYFKGADACLIIYDISSLKSYEQIAIYYNMIKEKTEEDCLLYIVGCKSDLKQQVSEELIKKNYKGIKHFVTSAKNNENVIEVFHELEQELLKTKIKRQPVDKSIFQIDIRKSALLDKQSAKKEKCC